MPTEPVQPSPAPAANVTQEEFESLVERHNHLVRKNQALLSRITAVENASADYEARATATVETLNETIKQLQAQIPNHTPEAVPSEDVEVVA